MRKASANGGDKACHGKFLHLFLPPKTVWKSFGWKFFQARSDKYAPKREILPHGNDAAFERRGRDEIRTAVDIVRLFCHTHFPSTFNQTSTQMHTLWLKLFGLVVFGVGVLELFSFPVYSSLSLSPSLSLFVLFTDSQCTARSVYRAKWKTNSISLKSKADHVR